MLAFVYKVSFVLLNAIEVSCLLFSSLDLVLVSSQWLCSLQSIFPTYDTGRSGFPKALGHVMDYSF